MGLTCTLHALSEEDASFLLAGNREHQPRILDSCELDKAWGAIHYFISGSSAVNPGNPEAKDFLLSGMTIEDMEGVTIHTCIAVAAFANQVTSITSEQLMSRFDPDRMNEEKVYLEPWDESGREYVLQFIEPFRRFIVAAADAKRAVLVVIC
ncbi:DUF1877 family protein [Steroidobacter cummioxidans]|uniref:DUF1877 family protein n=1 Tax=Steroidobacter cummioxidans TaxID=1803913 RepID=UPI000E31BD10|nr:DUF1877 family protein [Steroidobacter cummioxidans]